jgi:AcrR family transcriptional regulator
MPKRIPHLAETILERASQLFSRQGYDAVDMKMVAAEAGTSVGNLYNYFPSKPALFLAIVQRWKRLLLDACEEILESDQTRREKILAILGRLYDDVASWQGLWKEFLSGREERTQVVELKAQAKTNPNPWGLGSDEVVLLAQFEQLLTGSTHGGPHRWAYLVIMATLQLASRYPNARDENWKFIETLVDKI